MPDTNPRIREEQIDRSECLLGRLDQDAVAFFGPDVGANCDRTIESLGVEPVGHETGGGMLQIGNDNPCTFGVEALRQSFADSACGARHNSVLPHEFHLAQRRR
jgi:hypothetical protein